MVEPAAFKPAGAIGTNGITRREVACVSAIFKIDVRANELPRKIKHFKDVIFHITTPFGEKDLPLIVLDACGGQTFSEAALNFDSPSVPESPENL